MSSLVEGILCDEPKHAEAREYLVNNFLLQDPLPLLMGAEGGEDLPVAKVTTEEEINICGFLASEGILRESKPNQFVLASFLVRNLVTWAIRSKLPKPEAIHFDDIPWKKPGSTAIDMPRLVSDCVRAFDKERMRAAPYRTHKLPGRTPAAFERVPSEACYHHELFLTLSWWLDSYLNVASEVNAPKAQLNRTIGNSNRQRCNLFVLSKRGASGWRCALELCASAAVAEVKDHFDQAVAYGAAPKASETWVINFDFCGKGGETHEVIWPLPGPNHANLGVINIVHDVEWTKAFVRVNGGAAETVHLV